jgi:hypothetical protein
MPSFARLVTYLDMMIPANEIHMMIILTRAMNRALKNLLHLPTARFSQMMTDGSGASYTDTHLPFKL